MWLYFKPRIARILNPWNPWLAEGFEPRRHDRLHFGVALQIEAGNRMDESLQIVTNASLSAASLKEYTVPAEISQFNKTEFGRKYLRLLRIWPLRGRGIDRAEEWFREMSVSIRLEIRARRTNGQEYVSTVEQLL